MKSAANRLIITVIGTILLPIIVYSVYEISSITEDEEVIEKVYHEQLNAIIFSVNQFSDDNLSSILNKLEDNLSDSLTLSDAEPFLAFSNFNVLLLKAADSSQARAVVLNDRLKPRNWLALQDSLLAANPELSEQLLRYKTGGYRKIEPIGTIRLDGENQQIIRAVLDTKMGEIQLTGLLSIEGFANNVLAPKLQQIAEGELVITLGYSATNQLVYLTDSLTNDVILRKSMWLFPDLEVGISSSSKTVKELVEERMYYNLGSSLLLISLLIFGFSLVVRNFRREMHLAQTKSDFVSNVSHELRTPLSLISMFAETLFLDRVPSQEKRKEYEEIILKETNRLTNIVNKILNFSQIEANKRTYTPTCTDINELLREVVHDYAYHIEKNGFTHSCELTEPLPQPLVDREGLYEALVNLVDNAIKYSDQEKNLVFRTGQKGNAVYLEVEDKGIGIATDKVKQIFEKFYRVTDGNVYTTQGAGLGLALVSHIMDAHNGDVEVESTLGKGSTFRLVFYLENHGENISS